MADPTGRDRSRDRSRRDGGHQVEDRSARWEDQRVHRHAARSRRRGSTVLSMFEATEVPIKRKKNNSPRLVEVLYEDSCHYN